MVGCDAISSSRVPSRHDMAKDLGSLLTRLETVLARGTLAFFRFFGVRNAQDMDFPWALLYGKEPRSLVHCIWIRILSRTLLASGTVSQVYSIFSAAEILVRLFQNFLALSGFGIDQHCTRKKIVRNWYIDKSSSRWILSKGCMYRSK